MFFSIGDLTSTTLKIYSFTEIATLTPNVHLVYVLFCVHHADISPTADNMLLNQYNIMLCVTVLQVPIIYD